MEKCLFYLIDYEIVQDHVHAINNLVMSIEARLLLVRKKDRISEDEIEAINKDLDAIKKLNSSLRSIEYILGPKSQAELYD